MVVNYIVTYYILYLKMEFHIVHGKIKQIPI